MHLYSYDTISDLIQQGQVLEQDGYGVKVVALQNGLILKLFRRKRLFSSALLYPYSKRFINHAKALTNLNIPTVVIDRGLKVVGTTLTGVIYHPLPGKTLAQLNGQDRLAIEVPIERLAKFIHEIHEKGVYFRSLHLGNIVLTPEAQLGLIDIADMQFKKRSLSCQERERNFQHLNQYLQRSKVSFPFFDLKLAYEKLSQ